MKLKSFVCACLLSGFVASATIEATWFSSVRFMPVVKAVKNVCLMHKKKFIGLGAAAIATAIAAYKRPSLWTKTLNIVSFPFKKLYTWMSGNGKSEEVVGQRPSAPEPLVPQVQPIQDLVVPFKGAVLREVGSCISASMLAAGTGDAMGRVTEFLQTMPAIEQAYPRGIHSLDDIRHPSPTNPLSNRMNTGFIEKRGKAVAPYTDDTRMAMLVMEELIQFRRWATQQGAAQGQTPVAYINAHFDDACHRIMTRIAIRFIRDCQDPWGWRAPLRAPGNGCKNGVDRLSDILRAHGFEVLPDNPEQYPAGWWRLENDTGGCGSVMHAYPFGLVFYDAPELAARLSAEHSRITHAAPSAVSACASMAMGAALALRKLPAEAILHHMYRVARQYDMPGYRAQTAPLIAQALHWAHNPTIMSQQEVFARLQGWNAHEAIAAAVYIFASRPDNVREALAMGVHTPGDSDSIASLAGALVGAQVGMNQIPADWPRNLEDATQLAGYGDQVISQE